MFSTRMVQELNSSFEGNFNLSSSQGCGSGSSKFGQCGSGPFIIKTKLPNFSKHIYSISLISKSKILLIFKSEPKP